MIEIRESRQARRALERREGQPIRLFATSPYGNRATRRARRPEPAEGATPRRIVYSPAPGRDAAHA